MAPKLAGSSAWYMRHQIANYQAGIRGTDPADTAGMTMRPMAMTLASPAVLENVIAYIETLPDNRPATTITGDAERGRVLYQSCAVCHGDDGMGNWNTNAPRLAGMSDWYMANQLVNFKSAVRGGHADDVYGDQMHLIAGSLTDDAAINDVVAYINTL